MNINYNNQNSSCRFSETLISYLYDEIAGQEEKSRFESHLLSCHECAEELSAFAGVRSTVLEWRQQNFEPLSTPAIELAFETENDKAEKISTHSSIKVSWLTGLKERFFLSRNWVGVVAGFAALLICAGLFYAIVVNSNKYEPNQAAANKNSQIAPAPVSTVENSYRSIQTAETNNEMIGNTTGKSEVRKIKDDSVFKTNKGVSSVKNIVTNNNRITVRQLKTINPAEKVITNERQTPSTNQRKPSKAAEIEFSTRAEEDKSLRLSDLFDDVSMK